MENSEKPLAISRYVVASALKRRAKLQGMSMSAKVLDLMSDQVGEALDRAIANAKVDKRKTVLERDLLNN